jgi:hypothetical protein
MPQLESASLSWGLLSVFAIRFAVQGAFVTVTSREDENIDERIEFHKESCQTDAATVTRTNDCSAQINFKFPLPQTTTAPADKKSIIQH